MRAVRELWQLRKDREISLLSQIFDWRIAAATTARPHSSLIDKKQQHAE
jgi:hypothetical protein